MQSRCKKCGRPLSSTESIARGMGPECAGVSAGGGKSVRTRKRNGYGTTYNVTNTNHAAMSLFAWSGDTDKRERIPDELARFSPDLLNLVLSAPATGAIAMRVKSHRRKKSKLKGQSPILTLREIRRTCISLRMLFWPGFSFKGEPLACIPRSQNKWIIGQTGREISTENLISYLSRYGVI